jgi:hypothetical protein
MQRATRAASTGRVAHPNVVLFDVRVGDLDSRGPVAPRLAIVETWKSPTRPGLHGGWPSFPYAQKAGSLPFSRFCERGGAFRGLCVTARLVDFGFQVVQGVLVRRSFCREQELMEMPDYIRRNPVQQDRASHSHAQILP